MEKINNLTLVSVISILIALSALVVSAYTVANNSKKKEPDIKSCDLQSDTRKSHLLLFQFPELLKLHNITKEDLEKIDATEIEVIYVMQYINDIQPCSENKSNNKINYTSFPPYIQDFLRNPKVKAIWSSVVQDKFAPDMPTANAIKEFYNQQ